MANAVYSTGNEIVDAMIGKNFTGNVIPQTWYKTVTWPANPKPYLLAIVILSDIVYWYRPQEIRDEGSGAITGFRKRFRSDLLQRSYDQLADMYGETKRSITAAVVRLEQLGVIKRVFRTVEVGGIKTGSVLFIELVPEVLFRITYLKDQKPDDGAERDRGHAETSWGSRQDARGVTFEREGGHAETSGGSPQDVTGVTPEREPYTKNTTKITDINIINHLHENARDRIFSAPPDEDGLKEQVHFDSLKTELTDAEKGVADDILGIMTEIMSVDCETVRIGRADIPLTFVRDRVSKITQEHIRYVIDSFMKNVSEVTNLKAYLLTMLYNAPNTMNAYNQSCKNNKHGNGRDINHFHNFEERDYDYDELEKQIRNV